MRIMISVLLALFPITAFGGVGDKYTCKSSKYIELKADGTVQNYYPVTFEIIWDSPKDSSEEIIYIPEHPELTMSKTLYQIEDLPKSSINSSAEMISFNLKRFPDEGAISNNASYINAGGLLTGRKLFLTYSSTLIFKSVTVVIADCAKT